MLRFAPLAALLLLTGCPASSQVPVAPPTPVSNGGSLISPNGGTIVASGGGNIVASGAGNVADAGAISAAEPPSGGGDKAPVELPRAEPSAAASLAPGESAATPSPAPSTSPTPTTTPAASR